MTVMSLQVPHHLCLNTNNSVISYLNITSFAITKTKGRCCAFPSAADIAALRAEHTG